MSNHHSTTAPGRPLGIYLAGKVFEDLGAGEPYADDDDPCDMPMSGWRNELLGKYEWGKWATRGNHDNLLVLNRFRYVGPLVDEAQAGHGMGLCATMWTREHIASRSLCGIAASDVLFAWLEGRDSHGTLVEIGYATGLRNMGDPEKPRIIVSGPAVRDHELWFAVAMADVVIEGDDPCAALEAGLRGLGLWPTSRWEQFGCSSYREYLQTPHWQAVRQRAREHARSRCQLCGGAEGPLDVHHNTYERLGREETSDVILLCRGCHAKHHDKAPVI